MELNRGYQNDEFPPPPELELGGLGPPVIQAEDGQNGREYTDYFMPANTTKKGLRGEKLYVSKRDPSSGTCKRVLCWMLALLLLAAAIAVSVLIGAGFIDPTMNKEKVGRNLDTADTKSDFPTYSLNNNIVSSDPTFMATNKTVPNAVGLRLKIENMQYSDQLDDNSSELYSIMQVKTETGLEELLEDKLNKNLTVKVKGFSPGSIIVSYIVSWPLETTIEAQEIQSVVSEQIHENNGVVFQTFVINQTSVRLNKIPDECDVMNCSDGCRFDDVTTGFACTCPDHQELADQTSCVPKVVVSSPIEQELSRIEDSIQDIADKIDNIVEGGDNGEVEGSENVEAPSGKGGILSGMINATSEAEPNQMVAVGTKMEEQTSQEAREEDESDYTSKPSSHASTQPDLQSLDGNMDIERVIDTFPPAYEVIETSTASAALEEENNVAAVVSTMAPKRETAGQKRVREWKEREEKEKKKKEMEMEMEMEEKEREEKEVEEKQEEEEGVELLATPAREIGTTIQDVLETSTPRGNTGNTQTVSGENIDESRRTLIDDSQDTVDVSLIGHQGDLETNQPEPEQESTSEPEPEQESTSEPETQSESEPTSEPESEPESESEPKSEPEPEQVKEQESGQAESEQNSVQIELSVDPTFAENSIQKIDNEPVSNSPEPRLVTETILPSSNIIEARTILPPSVIIEVQTILPPSVIDVQTTLPPSVMDVQTTLPPSVIDVQTTLPPSVIDVQTMLPAAISEETTTTLEGSQTQTTSLPPVKELTTADSLENAQTETQTVTMDVSETTIDPVNAAENDVAETTIINAVDVVTTIRNVVASANIEDTPTTEIETEATTVPSDVIELTKATISSVIVTVDAFDPIGNSIKTTIAPVNAANAEATTNIVSEVVTTDNAVAPQATTVGSQIDVAEAINAVEQTTSSVDEIPAEIDVDTTTINNVVDTTSATTKELSSTTTSTVTTTTPTTTTTVEMTTVKAPSEITMSVATLLLEQQQQQQQNELPTEERISDADPRSLKSNSFNSINSERVKASSSPSTTTATTTTSSTFPSRLSEISNAVSGLISGLSTTTVQSVTELTSDESEPSTERSATETTTDFATNGILSGAVNDSQNCLTGLFCDGKCLGREKICDSLLDCVDGRDEQNCLSSVCRDDEWQCPSGRCIPVTSKCSGRPDCSGGEDEVACQATCTDSQFLCREGRCISASLKCDGTNDCIDGDDEVGCECGPGEFQCEYGGGCVNTTIICDGTPDCPDRSDEFNCVRLDNSTVQVRDESGWSSVCFDGWTSAHSRLTCAQLGLGAPVSAEFLIDQTKTIQDFWVLSTTSKKGQLQGQGTTALKSSTPTCSSSATVQLECQPEECGVWELPDSLVAGLAAGEVPEAGLQWPSLALAFNVKSKSTCTATIIGSSWLITSITCLQQRSLEPAEWVVFGGPSGPTGGKSTQIKTVSGIYLHPLHRILQHSDQYNVALIKLQEPLLISKVVKPICLKEDNIQPRQLCVSVGWSQGSNRGVSFSQYLGYLPQPQVETSLCNSTSMYNGHVTADQFCSLDSGDSVTCQDDEGSTVVCVTGAGSWELAGILSSRSQCRSARPSLYTSLPAVHSWIHSTTGL